LPSIEEIAVEGKETFASYPRALNCPKCSAPLDARGWCKNCLRKQQRLMTALLFFVVVGFCGGGYFLRATTNGRAQPLLNILFGLLSIAIPILVVIFVLVGWYRENRNGP